MSAMFKVQLEGQTVPIRFQTVSFSGIREIVEADVLVDIDARAAKAADLSDLASIPTAQNNLGVARVFTFRQYAATGDGETDDTDAVQDAVDAVGAAGGGTLDGEGRTYLINSAGIVVNDDRVFLENFTFKRTTTTTGWLLQFATTNDVTGGGVRNARFVGLATVSGGNAGLRLGSSLYHFNDYDVKNVEASGFAQYGVGIEAGSRWSVSGVRVVNHGLTTGTISSCMGFYLFPLLASSGGHLTDVYSEISAECQANASANTAALKIQTHQKLIATNLTAIGGSEQACSIDSVDGTISNLFVKQEGTAAGLAVGNYNTAHSFSGQVFTLDGFEIENDGTSNNNEFVIAGGTDGQYKLTGCTIRNGRGGGAGYLSLSNAKDCTFENLDFEDIRFDATGRSFTANSAASTNNRYINCIARGGTATGTFMLEATESVITNCGSAAVDGDTVGTFQIRGASNVIVGPIGQNVSGNGLTIIGDSNEVFYPAFGVVSGRSVWFQSGSDNNRVYGGNLWAGTGVLDSGTGNLVYGSRRRFHGTAAPTTGTWAVGDVILNTAPAANGISHWACTVAGTPGTWVEVRAIQKQTGWTAGTGTANLGAFATYAGQNVSAAYVEAEAQATDDATKANSQRIKGIEDALRTAGIIN